LIGGLFTDVGIEGFVGFGAPLVPLVERVGVARVGVPIRIVDAGVSKRARDPLAVFDDVAPVTAKLEPRDALFHSAGRVVACGQV